MTCIAIMETPRTAELDSLLSVANPLPYEELPTTPTGLVTGFWFKADPEGGLVELVDSLEVGECLSLDENQLSLIIYDGLRDVMDTTGKAASAVAHQIGNMQDYIEEQLDFHGAVKFLKETAVLIKRLS